MTRTSTPRTTTMPRVTMPRVTMPRMTMPRMTRRNGARPRLPAKPTNAHTTTIAAPKWGPSLFRGLRGDDARTRWSAR